MLGHFARWFVVLAVGALCGRSLADETPADSSAADSKPGKMVSIELLIVEISAKPGLESQERLGAAMEQDGDKLAQQVGKWERQGDLDYLQRFRLQALENQKAMVQIGATTRVTRVIDLSGRSRSSSSATQQTGSIVTVTPRIDGDRVIVEMRFEQTRTPQPESADEPDNPPGTPPAGLPGVAPRAQPGNVRAATTRVRSSTDSDVRTTVAETTLSVPNGKTIVAGGVSTTSSKRLTRQLILLSAKFATPVDTKASKTDN